MWTNPWFIGTVIVILLAHVVWFILYAVRTLKENPENTNQRKEDGRS